MRLVYLPIVLLLAITAAGCARAVSAGGDPNPMAVLIVNNQTTWEVGVTAQPEGQGAETLMLGVVEPESTATFENLPANLLLVLQAIPTATPQILTRPARRYEPGERVEWILTPGAAWRALP